MEILLNNKRNKNSLNKDIGLSVGLTNKEKSLDELSFFRTVNSNLRFMYERGVCNDYRLILTIEPFCTNILFNPLTTILDNDGNIIDNVTNKNNYINAMYKPYGNENKYLPGYNIFDMIMFRTELFKRGNFLDDRYTLPYNLSGNYHVYGLDDIIPIAESINKHLMERNGWVGFKIPPKLITNEDESGKVFMEDYGFKNCDFIDLFPSREYFSFNSMYDEEKKEEVKNWDVLITYPYKNYYDNFLVKDVETYENEEGEEVNPTGIPIVVKKPRVNRYGKNILDFTLAYKHNINIDDKIRITYIDGNIIKYKYFRVYDVNDNIISIDDNILAGENTIRVERVVGDIVSDYYIRMFRKLPNFKFEDEKITINNINEKLENNNLDFSKTVYPLAFSSTIYGDELTQYTFTDNISTKFLTDNLKRPLTEFYVTIVKNNEVKVGGEEVFGPISSGFGLTKIEHIDNVEDVDGYVRNNHEMYSSIYKIHNVDSKKENNYPKELEKNINKDGNNSSVLSNENEYYDELGDNLFAGDIVEFNKGSFEEIVLEDVLHRFNTTQREKEEELKMVYHEIQKDDGDVDNPSQLATYNSLTGSGFSNSFGSDVTCGEGNSFIYRGEITVGPRPEGYYYKPHHKIQLKKYSNSVKETSFRKIHIKEIKLDKANNFIYLYTYQKQVKIINGDVITINNEKENYSEIFTIGMSSKDLYKIRIPYSEKLVEILQDGDTSKDEFKKEDDEINVEVRRFSNLVPSYAMNVGRGRYVWRDILKEGEVENINDTPIEHIFTNGSFYVNKQIKFFLRRQDSFGKNGLLHREFPNDIYGDTLELNNIEFIETDELC